MGSFPDSKSVCWLQQRVTGASPLQVHDDQVLSRPLHPHLLSLIFKLEELVRPQLSLRPRPPPLMLRIESGSCSVASLPVTKEAREAQLSERSVPGDRPEAAGEDLGTVWQARWLRNEVPGDVGLGRWSRGPCCAAGALHVLGPGGGGATWGPRAAIEDSTPAMFQGGPCQLGVSPGNTSKGRTSQEPRVGQVGGLAPRAAKMVTDPQSPRRDELGAPKLIAAAPRPCPFSVRRASLGGPPHRRGPLHVHPSRPQFQHEGFALVLGASFRPAFAGPSPRCSCRKEAELGGLRAPGRVEAGTQGCRAGQAGLLGSHKSFVQDSRTP